MRARFRRWRFVRAYMTLRRLADRHRAAGHSIEFAAVNESLLSLRCKDCPDLSA